MKRIGKIISVCVLGILVMSACGTSKKGSESNQQSAVSKKEKETILPIGNEYVYQEENKSYVKLTILSENEWSLQTDEMHFPEKFQVKDTKQDKDGYKLLEMTTNKGFSGNGKLTVREGEPWYYYLVDKGDKIGFDLKVDNQSKSMDVEKAAEYRGYFIKQ